MNAGHRRLAGDVSAKGAQGVKISVYIGRWRRLVAA